MNCPDKRVSQQHIGDFGYICISPNKRRMEQRQVVPRLFPPPVFDRILYAKTEGEGLGERVMCVTSGRHEGRHGGAVTDRCNSQTLR